MGQYNRVYNDLECCMVDSIDKFPINKETRCFIKFSLPNFDIICTHLEAYVTSKREKEIDEINDNISRSTIILGDFNMITESDYSSDIKARWIDHAKYTNYKNISLGRNFIDGQLSALKWKEVNGLDKINMTNWNGTRIDYIFYKNIIEFPNFYETVKKLDLKERKMSQYIRFLNNYQELIKSLHKDKYNVSEMITEFETFKGTHQTHRTTSEINNFCEKHWDIIVQIYTKCLQADIGEQIKNSGVYFSDSSDHLPLYVDIKYNFFYLITPGLEEIENNEEFLKNSYLELNVNKFICVWNKINETMYDQGNFYVYNGQPSASYKWINYQSAFDNFKDPYNFGTAKGSNSLGNNGLYGHIV